jgi:hypothetical protein
MHLKMLWLLFGKHIIAKALQAIHQDRIENILKHIEPIAGKLFSLGI